MAVAFDPRQPPGTQLLSLGDDRIRELNQNLNLVFGGDGVNGRTFGVPFSFFDDAARAAGRLSVVTPVNDGEIVPKGYADSKLIVSTDLNSSDSGNTYTGTTTPTITAYVSNGLYLVTNVGPANAGSVSIQLGTAGFKQLLHLDGSALQAGDLFSSQMALLAFDGTAFRLINFIGGSLSADPTIDADAATKRYVDKTVNPATSVGIVSGSVAIGAAATTVMQTTVTIPADGTYQLLTDYCFYINFAGAGHAGDRTIAWVADGTATWAVAGVNTPAALGNAILSGCGMSAAVYTSGTVTVTLTAVTNDIGVSAEPASGLAGTPVSYLRVTLIRTHS